MEGLEDAAGRRTDRLEAASHDGSNVVALQARRTERARTGPSDEDLMRAYAGGDASAFERLYDRHETAVYRFLLRSVGSTAAAEDLLQETWLSVVRHAAGWQAQAAFRTWLFTVARTRLIDHWRAREPALLQSLDAPAGDGAFDEAGPALVDLLPGRESDEPLNRVLRRAEAEAVMQAVRELPPAQREVVLLHVEGELTLEQIGQVTGAGFETAKSRLRYALDKLRAARKDWA